MTTIVKDVWPPVSLQGSSTKRYPSGNKMDGATGNHVTPVACRSGYVLSVPSKVRIPSWYPSTIREWSWDTENNNPFSGFYSSLVGDLSSADNASWSSLVDRVRSGPAQLGVAFAEWGQSFDMVTRRALALRRAYSDLRRGRFRKFLRELSIGAKRKHRNLVKSAASDASNLWLEYSFGWKPMTQDIYDACTALQKPLPGGRAYGSGKQSFRQTWSAASPGYNYVAACVGRTRQGGDFYVTNPNAYLTQQLGIRNPASIAWELVPFSFLADWAFDIGSFLGGFTDMAGITIVRPYCSRTVRYTNYVYNRYTWAGKTENTGPIVQRGVVFQRTTSLVQPVPNFDVVANVGQSWRRAANAVSLLTQILVK